MRIHLLSDLHLEFGPVDMPRVEADVTVLAGDIHLGTRGLEWAAEHIPDRPVIYVAGNHEFYGGHVGTVLTALEARAAELNILFCTDAAITVSGTRFVCATLWTDLHGETEPADPLRIADEMSDYRKIRFGPGYRKLRPSDTVAMHRGSVRWLSRALAVPHDGPTVVVTHHAPSFRSLSADGRSESTAPAYASDLSELMTTHAPSCWLHGHTHHNVHYRLGPTVVVSNQRGYPHDSAQGFDPRLVLVVRGNQLPTGDDRELDPPVE